MGVSGKATVVGLLFAQWDDDTCEWRSAAPSKGSASGMGGGGVDENM